MLTAAELMNTNVISIHPEASIREAIEILATHSISGLPVVDAESRVIGMISERDILHFSSELHVIPLLGFSGWMSPHTDVSSLASFKKGFHLVATAKVQDVMSKKLFTAGEKASWSDIASLMKKAEINRIPVVDESGKLCGIVTRTDLLNHLAEGNAEEDAPSFADPEQGG